MSENTHFFFNKNFLSRKRFLFKSLECSFAVSDKSLRTAFVFIGAGYTSPIVVISQASFNIVPQFTHLHLIILYHKGTKYSIVNYK